MIGFITAASVCLLLLLGVIVIKIRKYSVQKALKLPEKTDGVIGNSFRSARQIGQFLMKRADTCGIYLMSSNTGVSADELDRIVQGKDLGIIGLVRLAHLLGCELVIRQVGTGDIEDPENTPDAYKQLVVTLDPDE